MKVGQFEVFVSDNKLLLCAYELHILVMQLFHWSE